MATKRLDYSTEEEEVVAKGRLASIIESMRYCAPGPQWCGRDRANLAFKLSEAQHILAGLRRYGEELK